MTPTGYASWLDRTGTEASVRIMVDCGNDEAYLGSGTAIGRDRVLSARHLFSHCDVDGALITVVSYDGTHALAYAHVSDDADLALVTLLPGSPQLKNFPPVAKEAPKPGAQLCWWGGDYDFDSNGYKKCAYYVGEDRDRGYLSGKGAPGNSGSGILNERGELVGVLVVGDWNPAHDFKIGFTALGPIQKILQEDREHSRR